MVPLFVDESKELGHAHDPFCSPSGVFRLISVFVKEERRGERHTESLWPCWDQNKERIINPDGRNFTHLGCVLARVI